jgi:sterol desaturase/sphingolipid hydroxylase (fatty acid hydroxylase superfamily)
MLEFLNIFWESTLGVFVFYKQNLFFESPWSQNYLWGLVLISLLVWGLEIIFPWRKSQAIFRKDFFTDLFHMGFNFVLFSIFISGFYAVFSEAFNSIGIALNRLAIINIDKAPEWLGLLIFFILVDFFGWITHIFLHKVPLFWKFHKVHHSVHEMGFAAHFRFHWMEHILYKPLKTFAVILIGGFEPDQAYMIHFAAILIGHLNHANIKLNYGPLKFIFNNPIMHLHHHAKVLPQDHSHGVNFGISLSLWDYLFGTVYIPNDNSDLIIGYAGDEEMPQGFVSQQLFGFKRKQ